MADFAKKGKGIQLGTVYPRGDKWEVCYYELNQYGEKKRRSKGGFIDEDAADAFLTEKNAILERELKGNKPYTENRDLTVSDYLVNWFENIYSQNIANNTATTYRYTIYRHILPALDKEIKLVDLTRKDLNELILRVAKTGPSYAKKTKEVFSVCMAVAIQDRLIIKNPVSRLYVPRYEKKKVIILQISKIAELLYHASKTQRYLEILLGLMMGLRKGEIYGLKFADFDFQTQMVHIQRQIVYANEYDQMERKSTIPFEKDLKTEGSERVLFVPDIVMEQVLVRKEKIEAAKRKYSHYEDNDYVSAQKYGQGRAGSCLNGVLNKITAKMELPQMAFHYLRHMTASILLYLNYDMATISRILGHASVKTTFVHYCADLEEGVQIAIAFDELLSDTVDRGGEDGIF